MEFSEALGASYRLGKRVGRGASGEVWQATDLRTGETVAAKILRAEHASDPALVERFVRERSILIGLRHPNIVAVRDLVVEGDRLAIVMDYVGGGSLRDVLDRQSNLPPQTAVETTAAVFRALAAAHQQRVLHRDIKPDNVLLHPEWLVGNPDACRVTDFGIARMITDRPRVSTGLLGTPEYMAPELISTGDAGMPGDVYAAGVLLYELLAGRTPFAGPGTDFTIAYRHVSAEVPALDLPDQLSELLLRLLDKRPQNRPAAADAAATLAAMRPRLDGLPALEPASAPEDFVQTERPATAVRGLRQAPEDDGDDVRPHPPQELGPIPDLGTPSRETVYRPMPRRSAAEPEEPDEPDDTESRQSWWRSPRMIGAAAGSLVLLVALIVVAVQFVPKSRGAGPSPSPQPVALQATQQDQPTPTGLGISRKAEYDSATASIGLTITYSAQKGPLRGPFLEVLPGLTKQTDCPTVAWSGKNQQQNLPSVTGITARCGWSVDGIAVPAQSSQQISVEVHLAVTGQERLQNWLDAAAAATTAAVQDADVSGTAYPVQRLQDIQVETPARIVSQKTLPITLVPVWPSGPDAVDPLYRSPAIGDPSTMLVAIAGGEKGVRFSDGCSGALSVSGDGLTVTTLSQAAECTVDARVGNFTDLSSQPFSIVTRGG